MFAKLRGASPRRARLPVPAQPSLTKGQVITMVKEAEEFKVTAGTRALAAGFAYPQSLLRPKVPNGAPPPFRNAVRPQPPPKVASLASGAAGVSLTHRNSTSPIFNALGAAVLARLA